jgi:predicted RND superfamily exporter protein
LLATSIVLAAGFAVLVFATVSSIAHTGLLIVVATLLAIITDIILLPLMVKTIK